MYDYDYSLHFFLNKLLRLMAYNALVLAVSSISLSRFFSSFSSISFYLSLNLLLAMTPALIPILP